MIVLWNGWRPGSRMFQWIEDHPVLLTWVTVASVVMFIATLVVVPMIIARLPTDHFQRRLRDDHRPLFERYAGALLIWLIIKNVLGALFLLAGVAMLVLPGQGILTMIIGISLLNFPGKHRLERALVQRPRVLRSLNWIRRRFGRAPFSIDRAVNETE